MSDATLPLPPAGPAGGATGNARGIAGFLAVRARVVHALILREMQTRFGRHNVGFVWLFIEPLMLGTVIGSMHAASKHNMPSGLDPFYFTLIGYMPYFMFRAIVGRSGSAMQANLTLLFHKQVTPLDIVLARNLLEAGAILGVIILIIGIGSWVQWDAPADIGLVILALSMAFLFANGLAMSVAALSARFEGGDRLVAPFTYFMLPISATFYALDWLPPEFRNILIWNPLVHPHEAIRDGIYGSQIHSYADLTYFAMWIIGVNLVGAAALRTARRKLSIF